jgi:transposase
MGAPKKADWREERRKQAWKLKQQGWKQQKIAEALGVSKGAVSQWMKKAKTRGEEALKAHPPKGVPARLSPEQKAQIPSLLARGTQAYGFRGEVWTAKRVAKVIEQTFGVRYSRDHVGRLIRESGWSRQKPLERASQRNEAAIEWWQQERWPALKKAEQEGRTILWVDEAGFSLLPMAVRTWAPRGQTPIWKVPLTRDHLSAISGITPDGRLFLQVRKTSYNSQAVIGFLKVLLRKITGPILLIWDGSPIHRSREIKAFLAAGAAKRLHLEQLPGYAPDLNPDEGIWNDLKRVEMANLCCLDLDHLHQELIRARERLRHKREIIRSCSRQCGYLV